MLIYLFSFAVIICQCKSNQTNGNEVSLGHLGFPIELAGPIQNLVTRLDGIKQQDDLNNDFRFPLKPDFDSAMLALIFLIEMVTFLLNLAIFD